jgi:alpha-1,3-rhamnosyl/mannosyltransferase
MAIRVLYTLDARTATPHFPGIGRYVRALAETLPTRLESNESLILLTAPGSDKAWPETGLERITTPASPFSFSKQRRIPPLLRGSSVYHSPYYLMPYRPGVPTVLTVYDLVPLRFPESVSLKARLVFAAATRLALRTAAHVIAISEACRSDYLNRFPALDPDRLTTIHLAPDSRFVPQSDLEIERVRRKYHLPPAFGLYVGINKPHKNLVRLIEAWAGLESDLPLVIAGAWDDRYPEPHRAAERNGAERFRFIGRIPDEELPALYSACRLFVFPSLYEGFGLPVVEALACGAAVACSNVSSLPEVGGKAATYFDPADVGAIRQALAQAIGAQPDPQGSVRQAARFSWVHTATATLEIYRSLAYNGR